MQHKFDGKDLLNLIKYAYKRAIYVNIRQHAANLTYTFILALVPLLSVSFAIYSAFPAFEKFEKQIQDFMFKYFLPSSVSNIQIEIMNFISATGSLTVFGVIFLLITSVMFLVTMSKSLNQIWRVKESSSLLIRFLVFWALITLLPILLGGGLSILPLLQGYISLTGYSLDFFYLTWLTPFIFEFLALLLLFAIVPNAAIRIRDIIVGAVFGAICLEVLKYIFKVYLVTSSFQTIYGAMALLPISLIWVFSLWLTVLYSANLVAALPEWRHKLYDMQNLKPIGSYSRFSTGILIMHKLWQNSKQGGEIDIKEINKDLHMPYWLLQDSLKVFEHKNWVKEVRQNKWLLCIDSREVSLFDVFVAFANEFDNVADTELQENIGDESKDFHKKWQKDSSFHKFVIRNKIKKQLKISLDSYFQD